MDSTDIASRRAQSYRFFSLIYAKEPASQFVAEISKKPVRTALEKLGVVFDELFDSKEAVNELGYEYVRLFIGTGPKHVPPYESVFSDEWNIEGKKTKRLMWGDSTVQVINTYEKAGFEPDSKFRDMPDHLAVELGFMEKLCLAEARAQRSGSLEKADGFRGQQTEFLEKHLLAWIDKFVEEVEEFATLQFYKTIAVATVQFLKSDYEELKKAYNLS